MKLLRIGAGKVLKFFQEAAAVVVGNFYLTEAGDDILTEAGDELELE